MQSDARMAGRLILWAQVLDSGRKAFARDHSRRALCLVLDVADGLGQHLSRHSRAANFRSSYEMPAATPLARVHLNLTSRRFPKRQRIEPRQRDAGD